MQEFTDKYFTTNEQHQEMRVSRQKRDKDDCEQLAEFFCSRNPFNKGKELLNIISGVIASKGVNVEDAKTIGEKIIEKMESANVKEFVFKRNMTESNFAKDLQISTWKGEVVSVDPQLLFQRLVAISSANENFDLETLFEYELSPYPPALFDTSSLMRSASKPKLAEALSKVQLAEVEALQEGVKYVLDGGALLQRFPWEIKRTYKQISETYVGFIKKNFGRNVVIVFDSYPAQPQQKVKRI